MRVVAEDVLTVPWPSRLNTDASPAGLLPTETDTLHNVMPRLLPHEIRPRNAMRFNSTKYVWSTATGNASGTGGTGIFGAVSDSTRPYHAVIAPDSKTMIVFLTLPGASPITSLGQDPGYAPGSDPCSITSLAAGYVVIDLTQTNAASNGTYNAQVVSTSVPDILKYGWGTPVYYDRCLFWCSSVDFYRASNSKTKYYDSSAAEHRMSVSNWPRVVVHGGAGAVATAANTATGGTATVTNGLSTVTMGATIATSMTGQIFECLGTPGTAGNPEPFYSYQYRIKAHTAGTATLTLDRPYGMGESATNVPNLVACQVTIRPYTTLNNTPLGLTTLGVFQERMFGARAAVSDTLFTGAPQAFPVPVAITGDGGYYGNALVWSKPGNWNRWPALNYALVGDDPSDPITALYPLKDKLIIFKRRSMWMLSGFDEDSFQFDMISSLIGCPHANGLTEHAGVLYFVNQQGIYSYDGTTINCLTSPSGQHGVRRWWNSRQWSKPYREALLGDTYKDDGFWPSLAVTPDEHLVLGIQAAGTSATTYEDSLVYDLKQQSFATWGHAQAGAQPVMVITAPNGEIYAIHRYFITKITNLWDEGYNVANTGTPTVDTYPTANAAGETSNNAGVVTTVDVYTKPSPGSTVRLRECQLDHRCWMSGTGLTDVPCWNVFIATDPLLYTAGSSQHTVHARMIAAGGPTFWSPMNFLDRFGETFQREGEIFRIRLTNTTPTSSQMQDYTALNLRLKLEATRTFTVGDSTPIGA